MTTTSTHHSSPVRAGVYSRIEDARRAVESLLAEGFTVGEITVVCSDEGKERHFKQFEHQHPAGRNAPAAAATGSTVGAAIGGIATTALGIAIGGPGFAVLGGAGLMTGGLVGGFLGAMLTRGIEKEAANFYDQAVQRGDLLVVVEVHGQSAEPRLAVAERAFAEAGARPLRLPEG